MNKQRKPVFTFKCVDCGAKNDTILPPDSNVLPCKKCGVPTVQTLEKVRR